jgi:hypothetical protein
MYYTKTQYIQTSVKPTSFLPNVLKILKILRIFSVLVAQTLRISGTDSQHKFSEFVAGTTLTKATDKTVKIMGHDRDGAP